MKKQIKKLNLNKRTISNLGVHDMNEKVAGNRTNGNKCTVQNCSDTCIWCCGGGNNTHLCTGNCTV